MQIYDRVLLVFTNDLRFNDNPSLSYAADIAISLGCVYCEDAALKRADRFGLRRSSPAREHFLHESLHDLDASLRSMGQALTLLKGEALSEISAIIDINQVNAVVFSENAGVYERRMWTALKKHHPSVKFFSRRSSTLFARDELPFPDELPRSFSKFRRKVETLDIGPCETMPKTLPSSFLNTLEKPLKPVGRRDGSAASGGERAALRHLETYFSSQSPLSYKETRNALSGWENSTKFSFWLANGALSARTLYHRLKDFETDHRANDSTYWIFFELLWREYFQWYAHEHDARLYTFSGLNEHSPLNSFYPERFKKWCEGRTPWPLVNACMKQLNTTGYMSNRGRQITASALINEMALDWRCGAAYFEQQLLDYDPASNWGNWQYIAGVGADPRGGRHFNIEKQTETYDRNGEFVKQWTDASEHIDTLDSVDAVDWPIA